jgi:hypothetical protein
MISTRFLYLGPSRAFQDTVMPCPRHRIFVRVGMLEYVAKVLPGLPLQQVI